MPTNVVIDPKVNISSDTQRTLIEVIKKLNFPFTVRVVSASREENGSNHDTSVARAVDFAVGYAPLDRDDSLKMREVAKALLKYASYLDPDANDNYGMIHSTKFSDDNGFIVLNGRHQPGAYDAAHVDHIHVATTLSRAQALLKAIPGTTTPPKPPPPAQPGDEMSADSDALWIKTALDKGTRTGGSQTYQGRPLMWLANRLLELEEQNVELKKTLDRIEASLLKPGATHTVRKGDTLWDIAGLYPKAGMNQEQRVEDIKRLNKLTSDNIHPGEILVLKVG